MKITVELNTQEERALLSLCRAMDANMSDTVRHLIVAAKKELDRPRQGKLPLGEPPMSRKELEARAAAWIKEQERRR